MLNKLKYVAVALLSAASVSAGPLYHSLSDGSYFYINESQDAIVKGDYKSGIESDMMRIADVRGERIGGISRMDVSPDEGRILIESTDNNFYIYKVESNRADKVSDSTGVQSCHIFSPDGRNMAFVRDNNIFIKRLQYNTEIRVTKDGSDSVYNGIRSAVYDSAFHQHSLMTFSPDGMYLLFARNNALCMYSVQYKWTKPVQLQDNNAFYVTAAEWCPDQSCFLVSYLNKAQNMMRIAKVDAATFVPRRIYEDKSKSCISPKVAKFITFFPDNGNFAIMSESDGNRHIYMYTMAGTKVRQLTSGKFDVARYYGYDAASKRIYYQASCEESGNRTLHYSSVTKPASTALVSYDGTTKARLSVDYKYIELIQNDINTPTSYSLVDSKGKLVRELGKDSGDVYGYERFENGWLIRSADADAPCVLVACNASNRYRQSLANALAAQGFTVALCRTKASFGDVVGSRADEYAIFADKLISSDVVKSGKLFIMGEGIYGGAAMLAVSRSKLFAGVIAISPVADLRGYNTIFTDRMMGIDKEADRYTTNSAIDNLNGIEARILLIGKAGAEDYRLIDTLVDANRQFDMQMYRNENSKHLITRIIRFINN